MPDLASITATDPKGLPANLMSMMTGMKSESRRSVEKPKVDHETPAQKQAAAKMALRKQLEKTLLQVR